MSAIFNTPNRQNYRTPKFGNRRHVIFDPWPCRTHRQPHTTVCRNPSTIARGHVTQRLATGLKRFPFRTPHPPTCTPLPPTRLFLFSQFYTARILLCSSVSFHKQTSPTPRGLPALSRQLEPRDRRPRTSDAHKHLAPTFRRSQTLAALRMIPPQSARRCPRQPGGSRRKITHS